MDTKICKDCDVEYLPYGQNGRRCKPCYNEYMRVYMLERYHRRRNKLIESRGSVCAKCNAKDVPFEIDHVDQYEKGFDIGSAICSWSEKRVQAEFEKCQILCGPCHHVKTRKDLADRFGQREHWEHGTLGGYRHCKCVDCKAAKSKYSRERRIARLAEQAAA